MRPTRSALVLAAIATVCGLTACTGAGSPARTTAPATVNAAASRSATPPPANLVTVTSTPLSTQNVPIELPTWHDDPATYARQALAVLQSVARSQGLKISPVSTEVVPAGKTVYCGRGIARQIISDGSDRASSDNGVFACEPSTILICPQNLSHNIHATQSGGVLGELLSAYVDLGATYTGKAHVDSFYAGAYSEGVITFALRERRQITDNQVIQVGTGESPYGTNGYNDGVLYAYTRSGNKYSALFASLFR